MLPRKCTRRLFLRSSAAAFPAGLIILEQPASAQDLPHLSAENPMAQALLYVDDAANVDTSKALAARFEPGQHCGNCVQLQGESPDEWRPCSLFPGKLVASAGWCSAWVKNPNPK